MATCLYTSANGAEINQHWKQLVDRADELRLGRDVQQSERVYRQALAESSSVGEKEKAVCLNRLGILYKLTGQYAQAESVSRRALDIWRSNAKEYPRQFLIAKSNLAVVLHTERKYHEAEKLLSEILESCERNLGSAHPDTVAALNNLGATYHEEGRLEQAERLYQRAYSLTEGPDLSVERLMTGSNLALIYAQQGRFSEADSLFQDVLTKMTSRYGRQQQSRATILNNYALLCVRLGRKEEAVRYVKEAVEIRDLTLGPDHPESIEAAMNCASVLRQVKRKKEAQEYASRGKSMGQSKTVDITSLLRAH